MSAHASPAKFVLNSKKHAPLDIALMPGRLGILQHQQELCCSAPSPSCDSASAGSDEAAFKQTLEAQETGGGGAQKADASCGELADPWS